MVKDLPYNSVYLNHSFRKIPVWQPNDNDPSSSHQENEEKLQSSSSQKDESNEDGLLDFQEYYVDHYVADQEGILEKDKDKDFGRIYLHFNFQEPLSIPNIYISQSLYLDNLQQLKSTLYHYHDRSNEPNPITDHLKYEDLQIEIHKRKTFQSSIDKRIDELSQYLTFTLQGSYRNNITYTNLNRSTLPLAIGHLQSILLAFKTWSYWESDRNEIDRVITEISKQCEDRLPNKTFWAYYTDSLPYTQPESPVIMLRINLNFELNNIKHSLNKTLHIRNIDQFKTILRSYNSNRQQDFVPLKSSSESEDIDPDITYRNTLQIHMDKVSKQLYNLFRFSIKEDEYDPLTLNLYYNFRIKDLSILLLIKHFELVTLTFKTWNNDENDRNAMNLYLSKVKDELLPLIKDESLESLWSYYIRHDWAIIYGSKINHLNLHILLKEYQHTITKTLQLQEPVEFITLLDCHNLLPNSYLSYSNTFDTSLSNLLYIFDSKQDNLNLYYYPLSNELDPSLIIKHLEGMISSFKILNQEVSNINISPTDITTLSQYLSSIAVELYSLSYNNALPSSLSVSIPSMDPSLISILLSPDSNKPWNELDNRLDAMINWTNLENAYLDDTYPRKVSKQSSPKIKDPKAYWKTWWSSILSKDINDTKEKKEDSNYGRDWDDEDSPILPLVPYQVLSKDPKDVSATDGRLGGASANFPNLLEVSGGDISMMEEID